MNEITPLTAGLLFVLALVVLKIIEQVITYLFSRLVKDDYLTKKQCDACKDDRKNGDNDFRREVREKLGIITGAIVVMAAGKEITMEDLQKLISSGQPR